MTQRSKGVLIIVLIIIIVAVGVLAWLSKAGKLKIGADVAVNSSVSYQSIAGIDNKLVKLFDNPDGTWTVNNNLFYFVDKDTKVVKVYNLKTQQLESAPTCPSSATSTTCGSFLVNAQNSTYLFSFSYENNQSKVYKLTNNTWVQFGDTFDKNLGPRFLNDNLWNIDRTRLAFFNSNGMVEFDFTTGKWSDLNVRNEYITKTPNPEILLGRAVRLTDNTDTSISAKPDALYRFLDDNDYYGGSNGVLIANLNQMVPAIKTATATILNHATRNYGTKVQKGDKVFIFGSIEPLINSGGWPSKYSNRSEIYHTTTKMVNGNAERPGQEITALPSDIKPINGKVINGEIYILTTDSSGQWKLIWVKTDDLITTTPTTSLPTTTATTAIATTTPPTTIAPTTTTTTKITTTVPPTTTTKLTTTIPPTTTTKITTTLPRTTTTTQPPKPAICNTWLRIFFSACR